MRHALLGTILLITATAGLAQNRPSLTWEGEVDGTALLIVQGDHVDVDNRSAASVSRTSYRFRTPLSNVVDRIDVENRLGGARVRVVEQPGPNNNYSAVVEIASRNRGPQRVSLDFYWQDNGALSRDRGRRDRYGDQDRNGYGTRSRTNDRAAGAGYGTAHWTGQVDNEVFVLLRGRQMLNTAVRGRSVYGQQADVSSPLPRRPVNVSLQDIQGRGQVELAEQPDQSNNFTAKVRIVDPEAGAGQYSFTLAWDESGNGYNSGANYPAQTYPSGGVLSPGGGGAYGGGTYGNQGGGYGYSGSGARWSGQVDGRVRVSFRDNQAWSQRISGANISGEQVSFGGALPRRSVDVDVRKLRGRGDVDVVQRPSANNNYTLVVEIDDEDGGSDVYDLEVAWR